MNQLIRHLFHLSVTQKLLLLVAIPLISLIYFSSTLITNQSYDYLASKEQVEAAQWSTQATNLIHYLQVERDLSIQNTMERQADTSRLQAAYQNTNHAIAKLRTTDHDGLTNNEKRPKLTQSYHSMEQQVQQLATIRQAIQEQHASLTQVNTYYSTLIDTLFHLGESYLITASQTKSFQRLSFAYFSLLRAENVALRIQAHITQGLNQKKIDVKEIPVIQQLLNEEKTQLALFEKKAPEKVLNQFQRIEENPDTQQLNSWITRIIKTPQTLQQLQSDNWFRIQAERFNQWQTLEKTLLNEIKNNAHNQIQFLWYKLVIEVIVLVLIVIGSIFSCFHFSRYLKRSLATVGSALDRFLQQDYTHAIDVTSNDEIGKTTVYLENIRTQLHEKAQMEEEELRMINRMRFSLDQMKNHLMILNGNHDITYISPSLHSLLRQYETDLYKHIPHFNLNQLAEHSFLQLGTTEQHRQVLEQLSEPGEMTLVYDALKFNVSLQPIFNDEGMRYGTLLEWFDCSALEEKAKKQEATKIAHLRTERTLDSVRQNVIIADTDYNIVYVNQSVHKMLQKNESEIQKHLPSFNVNELIGTNIDVFHKDPLRIRSALEQLTGPYKGNLVLGILHMVVTATPLFDEYGNRIGTITEWQDISAQKQMENEINLAVQAAYDGDFTQLIDTKEKEGFLLSLAEGLNSVFKKCDEVTQDIIQVMGALAQGNLSQRINTDYKGRFQQLKDNVNATASQINDVMNDTTHILSSITEGDLTQRIKTTYCGQFQELTNYVNNTTTQLTQILEAIINASGAIKKANQQLSSSNQDLSQRTIEQASNLEETAVSMEEISSMVAETAVQAVQSNELAFSAQEYAQRGGKIVERAVQAMETIETSNKEVSDIITVVDDIAFQTNLLALNAAVEAARAGEQGRGFAVVASEVRSLAQRSGEAAKNIQSLIKENVTRVTDGAVLVKEAGDALQKIVAQVEEVSTNVDSINTATEEQSKGVQQINHSVNNMDQQTQGNRQLVEEMNVLNEKLTEQVNTLTHLMSSFKLEAKAHSNSFLDNTLNNIPANEEEKSKPNQKESNSGWQSF